MIDRWIQSSLQRRLSRPFVHILFGARQTGKTTLLDSLVPAPSLRYNLADPEERTRLLSDPGVFRRECEALPRKKGPHFVVVDEAQNAPAVFDSVQVLYDMDKVRWRFVLCGSSARKLRSTGANLLPGRSVLHRLYPLILQERPPPATQGYSARSPALIPLPPTATARAVFPTTDLQERLAYGDLPGVVLLGKEDRKAVLRSYVSVHLEEEIRREALVKNWGAFVNFLRLAARESGTMVNFAAISREVGLTLPTVKSYYQLLEDMFIGFQVHAFSGSPRKNLLSTPRFYFFDLGVRHAACAVTPGPDIVQSDPGRLFEQWVGIEIWKRLQYGGGGRLSYYRTKDGAEVDFVVELGRRLVPIEVKWTERPAPRDATHLVRFLKDHPRAKEGYVICRTARPARLCKNVVALPWNRL
jgi:predicted AAA+ superfamily ATPase